RPGCGGVVGGGRIDETHARRDVDRIRGEAVVIEPDSKIEDQAGMNLPTILGKQSKVVASGGGGEQRIEINDLATHSRVLAQDVHGEIGEETLIGGTRKGITKGKEMAAVKLHRTKMQILRPLIEPRVASLGVEEGTGILFREKSHLGGGAIRGADTA